MGCLRVILGVTRWDKKRNTELRSINGGHRKGGGHDDEETAMVGPRGAEGRHSPPQVHPCVQAAGW